MTYSIDRGEAIHDPGPVALGLLKDIGWRLVSDNNPGTFSFTAASFNGLEGTGAGTINTVIATIQKLASR